MTGGPRRHPRSEREVTVRRARPLMGTLVGVSVVGDDPSLLEEGVAEAFAEMERLQSILSEWSPTSAVSRVNDAAGTAPVGAPPELVSVLAVACDVAEKTDGAFDPTWAALAPLWRLDAADFRPPEPGAVAGLLGRVGHRDLVVDAEEKTVWLRREGMRIGLGGVAKAYIAERGAQAAVARGVHDVLVDAGGDVVARGRNGDRAWTVGVRAPRSAWDIVASIELRDEVVVTSGDYERFVDVGGRRYHHVLDPRTGWPADRCTSATVAASSGALADALSTALFVLGAEGLDVVSAWDGVSAMVVRPDGRVQVSARGAERFRLRRGSLARRGGRS